MLPLKVDPKGTPFPVKTRNNEKVCKPDELVFFFKHGFSIKERHFKIMLLTQLGCACRIAEVCAINLNDFHANTNFRVLDMLIQKKYRINEIETKEIPESIAAHLRSYIKQNLDRIIYFNGYIFPPNPVHKTVYYDPKAAIRWMISKRKQLNSIFPNKGFDKIIGKKFYNRKRRFGKESSPDNIHMWSTHLMKRFAGTYAYLLTKDAMFVKSLLNHEKLETTQRHYIDIARVIENNKRRKVINELFDKNFYDQIKDDNEDMVAVWDDLK